MNTAAVEHIQPLITDAATVQGDAKKQPDGTTGLLSTILKLDEAALNTVTGHVLGGNPSLQTAQTMFRLLRLKNMEAGMQTKAFEIAEAALLTAAGSKLQSVTVQTGHEELDDLISVATQSPDYLDIARKRWGTQGVNYISSLITLGRGDLAAAIVAMPTYAKSAIIAETNMRAFGLNDAAIAAQENALKADMNSPIVVASAKQITKLQAVEARKTELIAGGALGDQSTLVQQMNVAGKTLNQSKSVFDQAVRKEQAGRNTLVLAQAAFHQNMADTKVADALVDAIASLQNASGERRKAEQAMKAEQQALDDAKRKLTDAQKQAMEKVTAQAKQDVDAAIRNRAETRNKLTEQDRGDIGQQGIVPSVSALSENVSSEGKEGNPLAQGNGSGIMGEWTQGEDTGGAGDVGKKKIAEDSGKVIVDIPFNETGKLMPNVIYKSGEFCYDYETDSLGRIERLSISNLHLTTRTGRLPHDQDTPGKLPSDHAGHLAGDRFGGSSELDNLVSQSSDVNLSQYKKIENQWAKAIGEGLKVQVHVDIEYDNSNLRPTKFNVNYMIEDEIFIKTLTN